MEGRMWDIEVTAPFTAWYEGLSDYETQAVNEAVGLLEHHGPALRRPTVGTIKSSRYANLRELIVMASDIRVLFAFDPRRAALLLLGGSKTGAWDRWYTENVPVADDLYAAHLAALE